METVSRASQPTFRLEQLAQAPLPTRHGTFQLRVFRWDDPAAHPALSREHCALILGEVRGRRNVLVRVHSECLTGEVFSSLKCDCREQFDHAQAEIAKHGFGVILYLRQEGRGIGLANKVRAYALQAMGADTVEANELLHLPVDARTYDVAAAMLRELGVESVELMTNNPTKVDELTQLGITVEKRLPVLIPANPFSASYLEVKRRRMQHELPSSPHVVSESAAESGTIVGTAASLGKNGRRAAQ
ncbi:MAG TPA: GTP cyclohydrolase II [Polyangiaceae bacterium]|jgi:GTP cyclohydrolase II|nr:GTP cyclohydrolase II [Polyangiaceae bacterium]